MRAQPGGLPTLCACIAAPLPPGISHPLKKGAPAPHSTIPTDSLRNSPWYSSIALGCRKLKCQRLSRRSKVPYQFPNVTGLTATELAAHLDVSKPVVSNTVQALLREGLLEATPHERDQRSRRIRLSSVGLARLNALLSGYYDVLQEHMHGQAQQCSRGPDTSS
ncbi:MAG: MarR family transcriptional regulator [Desulfovibrio sp.]|nr:MarR family transcriptional regulator [Desulfovibrio sp.]